MVAGIRTPQEITLEGSRRWAELQGISESERALKYPSLEEVMPAAFKELNEIQQHLENYFRTCRIWNSRSKTANCGCCKRVMAKRTGAAMVRNRDGNAQKRV